MANVTITEDQPYISRRVLVYTSPSLLEADWTEQPYLRPDSLSMVAGPDIDEAKLHIDFGYFPNRSDSPFDNSTEQDLLVEPLDIARQYVKFEFLDDEDEVEDIWVGRIAADEQDIATRAVTIDEVSQVVKTGTQSFTAYGLLWEWEYRFIDSSWVKKEDEDEVLDPERGLPFNFVQRAGGYVLRGNKDTIGEDDPVFSWEPWSDDKWTATDAIKYLCKRFPPETPAGNEAVAIDQTGADLSWYDISVETDRRSVKAVLDDLVDRRRLAGYYLKPKESGSSIICDLILFTFADEEIEVGDDTIPANSEQITLIVSTPEILDSAVLRSVATHVADRVIVEGAYITSTATIGLEKGWSTDQEEKLRDGASVDDEDENTIARCRDELKDVFTRHIMGSEFPMGVEGGYAITIQPEDIPDDVEDGDVPGLFNEPAIDNPWAHLHRRFLDYIAIKDSESDEFRRPFVVFPDGQVPGKWVYADQASVGDRQFSCHLHMLHDRPGIYLTPSRAGGNSLLGHGHWDGARPTPLELDPENDDTHAFDWEHFKFTGTIEWDDRVSATEEINTTGNGASRTRYIRVEDARLDFELPETITDIDENGENILSEGKVLRDDRARLRTIAAAAAQWYGTPRKALTLSYKSIRQWVSIGQLINSLYTSLPGIEEEVNTPITGIGIDFNKGTTTIETAYAEADFSTNRAGV